MMVCLTKIEDSNRIELAKKIQKGIKIMLKGQILLKDIKEIIKDLKKIDKEIYDNKAYFKVFFNEKGLIEGFYYIRVNNSEKFLMPFFETEFFYSETPKSFFACMKEAVNDLKKLKKTYPDIKQYIGYYTVDKSGEALSHAKLSNKRIKEIFGNKMDFKDVFKTFVGRVKD